MWYVVEKEYVGPNKVDYDNDVENILYGHYFLVTEDEMQSSQNLSGKLVTEPGEWLGTSNDWSATAQGKYETEEDALTEAKSLAENCSDTSIKENENEDGETVIYPNDYDSIMTATEWFQDSSYDDFGITADTDLSELASQLEVEAYNENKVKLWETNEYLQEIVSINANKE